jgi:hypothetical protein
VSDRMTFSKMALSASALATLVILSTSGLAAAQDKPQRGVITLSEVTIVGRVQKPIASVDVSKIQPKLTLAELRQPFLDRIEEATHSDPF